MGKPRLLIVIRHAQSEGNRNRDIHQTVPDHRVKLTSEGWQQAYEAGRRLRKMLRADDTLHFFTSPYRRTRETTEGILATLTSDEPEPSPFKRNNIKVYEEPRLREQDFGNFQPCSAEMERMWQERADYGHFFYRIPNGESAADAYDRISGFNESLWRQFGEDDFASVCVLVTHGLMSRVFLMKWYHFSVEYFEDLRNVNHCEFLIMRKNEESGKYILQNKLRTWSELRRERAMLKEKGEKSEKGEDEGAAKEKGNGTSKDSSKLTRAQSYSTVNNGAPVERRRWGGCPNGCNHDKNFKIRQTLADLVKSDHITSNGNTSATALISKSGTGSENGSGSSSNNTVTNSNGASPRTQGTPNPSFNGTAANQTTNSGSPAPSSTILSRRPAAKRLQSQSDNTTVPELTITGGGPIEIDVTKAREEVVSSPDGTPSFISVEDRLRNHSKSPLEHLRQQLHVGRDFGGTYSGHNSLVASDADSSEDEHHRRRMAKILGHKEGSDNVAAAVVGSNGSSLAPDGGKKSLAPTPQFVRQNLRDQSRMGRGARANRLGDHPHSSDGEHEADCEHEHDHDHHHHHHDHDHDQGHDGDGEAEEGEGEGRSKRIGVSKGVSTKSNL